MYIEPESIDALLSYKYKGGDNSYYYNYVLTPMNKRLIEYFPTQLAPNLITLSGLLFTTSANLLTQQYSPDFNQQIPGQLSFYVIFAIFVYQTLDNLDGRQARRTNSSSPLGLLFDHGIDAINITIASLAVFTIFRPGATQDLFLFQFMGTSAFFFATLEEYYTGELILPFVNGPSDGVLLSMLFCLLQALGYVDYGLPFKQNFPFLSKYKILTFFSNRPTYTIILYPELFLGALTVLMNLFKILNSSFFFNSQHISSRKSSSGKGKTENINFYAQASGILQFTKKNVRELCQNVFPYIFQIIAACIQIALSPSNFFQTSYCRLFLLANGFIFGHNVCTLMLAHVCDRRWRCFSNCFQTLTPLAICTLSVISMVLIGQKQIFIFDEKIMLCLLLVQSFIYQFKMAISVTQQLTMILGIRCFKINNKDCLASNKQLNLKNGSEISTNILKKKNGFDFKNCSDENISTNKSNSLRMRSHSSSDTHSSSCEQQFML